MSTTLSQRLRDLRDVLMSEESDTPNVMNLVDDCIAQAEAQEAQAGELSDEEIERIQKRYEDLSPFDTEADKALYAIGVAAGLREARDHYLKPSQAIGEQAPVAQANPIIGNVHERWHELGYGNPDRLHERFRGDPWRIFYAGWIEGRAPLVAQLKDNHRPFTEARDALAEYRDKHRSPVSPEARDRAISALEGMIALCDNLVDRLHAGKNVNQPFEPTERKCATHALSALRGQTSGT